MEPSAVIAIALGVIVVLLLIRSWAKSRSTRRRVAALVARMEGGDSLPEVEGARSVEKSLLRLERAIDSEGTRNITRMADRRRLMEAVDKLELGVVVADEAGHISYANPPALRYLEGRHADAIVNRQLRHLLRRALVDGYSGAEELELIGPPRAVLELVVHPLDDGERAIGAALFVVDRTETKRVDSVRRDFVANISHELKTPVAALGLLAETLVDSLHETEVAERLAGRIDHESGRLVRIIDDLVALSRLEAEEAPLREPLDSDLLAADAVERARSFMADADVQFELDTVDDCTLRGDRRQLTSALYNLVENAVKYSEAGDIVRVVVRPVLSPAGSPEIEFRVIDEGIGIPPRDLDRIFERFYRVDRARSRDTGGTGLGLAIVRHVVANHGGQLIVESEEGRGSTFTIRLPAEASSVPADAVFSEADPSSVDLAADDVGRFRTAEDAGFDDDESWSSPVESPNGDERADVALDAGPGSGGPDDVPDDVPGEFERETPERGAETDASVAVPRARSSRDRLAEGDSEATKLIGGAADRDDGSTAGSMVAEDTSPSLHP